MALKRETEDLRRGRQGCAKGVSSARFDQKSMNGAGLLEALSGLRTHLARSGAGKQRGAFGRIEHRGLKVRGLVGTIGPVEIDIAGHCKRRDQHREAMMCAIHVHLRKWIGSALRGFLMLVLVVPGVRGLGLGGLMTAILRGHRKGGLQRKHAKQKDEQQTFHLAAKSNIDPFHRQNFGRKPVDRQVVGLGNASGAVVSQRFNDRATDPSAAGAALGYQIL